MKPEITLSETTFSQQFSSTRRGAHLARVATTHQLTAWGWPRDSETSHSAALLTAELAANAARHGRLPGRDFRLRLTIVPSPAVLRIEVSDSRGENAPVPAEPGEPASDAESGRGLLLVEALASRWGTESRHPSGKTVWVELDLASVSSA